MKNCLGQVILLIRFIAIILISSGFAFSGHCLAAYQKKRVDIISDILLMLSVIHTQIRYTCVPVNDLLVILTENSRLKGLKFIFRCRQKAESGEVFPIAWKESLYEEKEFCRIAGNALSYLIQLGDDLGATDLDGQLSCCEYYKQFFLKELKEREEQNKKYSKLLPTLGVMLGISAAIIIV